MRGEIGIMCVALARVPVDSIMGYIHNNKTTLSELRA